MEHRSWPGLSLAALLAVSCCLIAQAPPAALSPEPPPAAGLRLLDVQLSLLAAVGGSTASDTQLAELQAGAHDPRQRGFTLQEAELGLVGAIDDWLTGRVYLIAAIEPLTGETIVELEEAYVRTENLPAGLTVEAGTFFTDFGRSNRQHPHEWHWLDQPVAHSRVFGGDGLRGPGARVAWLPAGAGGVRLGFGAQNAHGETMTSFFANEEVYDERGIGGRFYAAPEVRSASDLLYSARVSADLSLHERTTLGLGASALLGPNATGADANTVVYGVDLLLRTFADDDDDDHEHGNADAADDHDHGAPWFELQGEFLARAFEAAEQVDAAVPATPVTLPATTLDDYGGYLQGVWSFAPHWHTGLRVDWATGAGDSYDAGTQTFARQADPFRADRLRISPLLGYSPSERTRLRLQYNYDDSDHLAGAEHSVWLGMEVRFGQGGAHRH